VEESTTHASISVTIGEAPATQLAEPQLESLRLSIPAARSLPLLQMLARREPGSVSLGYLDGQSVDIEVRP